MLARGQSSRKNYIVGHGLGPGYPQKYLEKPHKGGKQLVLEKQKDSILFRKQNKGKGGLSF